VYAFGGSSLAIESNPVAARGTATSFIVAGATPSALVKVTAPGALAKTCTANAAGQCTATLVETLYGVIRVSATQGPASASSALRVPRNNVPLTVIHLKNAVFSVSFCPAAAKVTLTFSDGVTLRAIANAAGTATVTVRLPRAGKVSLATAVAGVHLGAQLFLVK